MYVLFSVVVWAVMHFNKAETILKKPFLCYKHPASKVISPALFFYALKEEPALFLLFET